MTEHTKSRALNESETAEAFHASAILTYGLAGLGEVIKAGAYREEELASDIFAFYEAAEDLHCILGKAICPAKEPEGTVLAGKAA